MNRIKNYLKFNLAKIIAVVIVLTLISYAVLQLGNALANKVDQEFIKGSQSAVPYNLK